MSDNFDNDSRDALIKYRLERSKETISEAVLLSNSGYYNAAVNRLYYACYYSAVALLLKNGISVQTHAGVKTMIGLKFVNTGKLSPAIARTFSILFNQRQSSDYDDFVYCDKEMVEELLPKAQDFLDAVKDLTMK